MAQDSQRVLVIGAGIAGLAVARALALRGQRVCVLEQAPEIREVGAGLQVSPNGMAVLRALGLDAALRSVAVEAQAVCLHDHKGPRVARLDMSRLRGDPYCFVHRSDLIALLARGARDAGVEIRTARRVAAVWNGAVGLESGEHLEAGLILGADGLHSVVRPAVTGGVEPFFTGQVAWRAVVRLEAPSAPEVRVFMGPRRHLVCYPLRDRRLINIVAVEERQDWVPEGWSHRDDPAHLRAAFAGFGPEVTALLARIDEVHLWGLFRHPVAAHWHRGRLALLGDAAHPTLPFLAQGANQALEDAWVLASSVSEAADLESGLARYQSQRAERVLRVIKAAGRTTWKYHLANPLLRWGAHQGLRVLGAIAPGLLLGQFDWIYRHDVTVPR